MGTGNFENADIIGLDCIFPALLQRGLELILSIFLMVVRVIFVTKAGKSDPFQQDDQSKLPCINGQNRESNAK